MWTGNGDKRQTETSTGGKERKGGAKRLGIGRCATGIFDSDHRGCFGNGDGHAWEAVLGLRYRR